MPASPAKPAVTPIRRTAITIERVEPGEWAVLELTLAGDKLISEKKIARAYHRDLAEQAAAKAMRGMGRK